MSFDELYEEAKLVLNPRKLSEYAEAGGVGALCLLAVDAVNLSANLMMGTSRLRLWWHKGK